MVGRGTDHTFKPGAGEPFNVIVSIQYRGYKVDDFKKASFASRDNVLQAIRVLKLDDDLFRMGLPRLRGPDRVFKSSLNYPFTLEVLFQDHELGKSSEEAFHSFYDRFSQNPRSLEQMKIKTIFLYFLPPNVTALNRFCHPTYVLERPRVGGWGNWIPDRNGSRRSSNVPAPSRVHERHWSPSSSQPESSCATSVALDDRASPRPQPSDINIPGPSSTPASRSDDVPPQKTRSPPPMVVSTTGCTLPHPLVPLSDPASISSAIQALSRTLSLVVPTTAEATVTIPESAVEPMPADQYPDIRQRDNELNNLRVEHERNTIVCDLQLKRIRELQQELADEREERLQAEAQVEAERHLLEAERRRLGDVQKECSTPFLVPALLQALLGTAGSDNIIEA